MKINGIKITEFKSDKPVVFDPPKKMLVWDTLSSHPYEKLVDAYIPSHNSPAICQSSIWGHCAEIPEAPKRMTNRQLAEWLAMGNGEKKRLDEYEKEGVVFASIEFTYELGDANRPVDECYFIRRWKETEWHEPTVDFFDEDCKGVE